MVICMALGSPLKHVVAGCLAAIASKARPRLRVHLYSPLYKWKKVWWPFGYLTHAQVRCLQVKDFVYTSSSVKCNKREKKGFFIRKYIKYSSFQGPKEIG